MRVLDGQRVVYVLADRPPEGEDHTGNPGGIPFLMGAPPPSLVPVAITIGAQSTSYSEVVTSNLNVGDQIVLNPPSDDLLFAGQQIP
jgi:hypothetical protein